MAKDIEANPPIVDAVKQIEAAREQGLLIHDIKDPKQFPGVTKFLARSGIFTTCEPEHPGGFKEFRRILGLQRQMGTLATNAIEALKSAHNPDFNRAIAQKCIGSLLVDLFADTDLHRMDGMYMADTKYTKTGELKRGTVTAELTTFTVSKVESQTLLSDLFQIWGRTHAGLPHIVRTGALEDKLTVAVTNLNEYDMRMMEHALSAIVAREDYAQTNTILPFERRPLQVWRDNGETFHPLPEARMEAVNQQYQRMREHITMTCRGVVGDLLAADLHDKPNALGSSAAAAFEVFRKGVNTIIRAWRKSGRFNQDQNPRKEHRLLIEKGVEITRDTGVHGQSGPPSTRALTLAENLKQGGLEYLDRKKKRPGAAIAKAITAAVGAGVESLVDLAADMLPKVRKSQLTQDWLAWRRSKRAAIESGNKIDEILRELQKSQIKELPE